MPNDTILELQCPVCSAQVIWNRDFPHRPFCSKRCQLIDFGDWAAEKHRIEGEPAVPDEFEFNARDDDHLDS